MAVAQKKRLPRRKNNCHLSRQFGTDLGLTSGMRPLDSKCKLSMLPGEHGATRRGSGSDYKTQLTKKQEFRAYYSVSEKQFRSYFKLADKQKGNTGENLLKLLESRLINVVYLMGFASTRAEARQLISHKAIMVNGQITKVPSRFLNPGDSISVREKAKGQLRINAAQKLADDLRPVPAYLDVDGKQKEGVFKEYPDMDALPSELVKTVNLVVELYSK